MDEGNTGLKSSFKFTWRDERKHLGLHGTKNVSIRNQALVSSGLSSLDSVIGKL